MTFLYLLAALVVIFLGAWLHGRKYEPPVIDPEDRIDDPTTGIRH